MSKKDITLMFSNMKLYEARNVIFSFAQNLIWRRKLIKFIEGKLLDVATGPCIIPSLYKGDSVGLDISLNMLKSKKCKVLKVVGDAENLPFKDSSFDTVSIAFGLRNVPDKVKAIEEFYRVLKPNGKLLILEMKIDKGLMGFPNLLYSIFMIFFSPFLLGSIKDYIYLFKSMLEFPDDDKILAYMKDAGFRSVGVIRFYLGPARLFIGYKRCME